MGWGGDEARNRLVINQPVSSFILHLGVRWGEGSQSTAVFRQRKGGAISGRAAAGLPRGHEERQASSHTHFKRLRFLRFTQARQKKKRGEPPSAVPLLGLVSAGTAAPAPSEALNAVCLDAFLADEN